MRRTGPAAITLLAVAVALLVAPASVDAQSTVRGSLKDFVYTSANAPISTSSNVAATVPGVSSTFKKKGPGAVLATFCAETQVEGTLIAGVYLDGVLGIPGEVSLDENLLHVPLGTSHIRAHCYVWVFDDIAPGSHQVEVRWRKLGTAPGGPEAADMFFRSLLVQF